jgi:rare lipoprotein A
MEPRGTTCLSEGTAQRRQTALAGRVAVYVFVAAALLCGCSTSRVISPSAVPAARPLAATPRSQVVTASWYGSGMTGRRTSSGEIFDPNDLTAASRSLPIGSRVRVTNVSNGRAVVVRINDRGPYVRGRSIDLSHAAAERIGLTRNGVGRVEVARPADESAQPSTAVVPVSYTSVPYIPMTAFWSAPRWSARSSPSHSSVRRRHRTSRARIVSNPVGYWILSSLPRF